MKSEAEITVGALTATIGALGALIEELATQGVIDPGRLAAAIHDMKSDRSPFRTANQLEALADKTGDRLAAIDKQLTRIETRQEEFTKHYATKADLTDAKNSIIMWVVGAVFLAQVLPALLKKFGL